MNVYVALLLLLVSASTLPALELELESVAGSGATGNNGDAGFANQIAIKDTFGVEIGPDGKLYVAEVGHHRIRCVNLKTKRISTLVGTGEKGYAGDGGSATKALLNEPYEVRFDLDRNLYFVEMQNHTVRRVDAKSNEITTIAGVGSAGFGGDGGPAINAAFHRPHSIALDGKGNLYVADIGNHRIRRVHLTTGVVDTVAGNGGKKLPTNGQLAKGNPMLGPRALYAINGFLWIALREGHSVWKLDLSNGRLEHVAGSGKKGFVDGGALQASFNGPKGIVVDEQNNAFVVDTENHVIRRIDGKTREVTTIAGTGKPGSGIAMNRPHGICLGSDGDLFVGDTLNHRVVRISN